MKKITFFVLLIAPFLMAMQCEPEPCTPKITQKFKENLITVENLQNTYNVGDILWLSSDLERNQNFTNPTETIDLFSFDMDLGFGLQFYKSSVYNPEIYLCLDETTTEITNGSLNNCNFFVYEKNGDTLKSRVGIKLLETGNYRIAIYNIASFRELGLKCEDSAIDINTTFSNNNEQLISFTVQ
jgi:hypothetical protein